MKQSLINTNKSGPRPNVLTNASEAYAARRAEIVRKAMQLAARMDTHLLPGQTVDWGHVGDLAHIVDCLNMALGIED